VATGVYAEPYPWTVRDLVAHFVSAEELLLRLMQDVAQAGSARRKGMTIMPPMPKSKSDWRVVRRKTCWQT